MAIKCMLGLHEIDSGQIIFNDRDFVSISDIQRKDRGQYGIKWI